MTESAAPASSRVLLTAAIALMLGAGVAGFVVGATRSPDDAGPVPAPAEIREKARQDALRQVRAETARDGFRHGREEGLRHGRKSGRLAGATDAEVVISQSEATAAEADASSAQSELSGISAAPPAP